jgi:hypothetical protein
MDSTSNPDHQMKIRSVGRAADRRTADSMTSGRAYAGGKSELTVRTEVPLEDVRNKSR